jgi:uncharacterized protein YyaL (SSP411 family)
VRARRVWPGLDDKILTAWNGLMLTAFAEAGRALDRPDYTTVAVQNAAFLHDNLRLADGRLLRSWQADAGARYNGYLEDYTHLADGLLALYQTTFEPRWFTWARELVERLPAHFRDEAGGFYDTSDDHEGLLYRPKDIQDNATPSGNSAAAQALFKMALYTGEGSYWDMAERMVSAQYEPMARYPNGFANWLNAAAFLMGDPQEVAISGDPSAADSMALLDVVFERYRPHIVVAAGDGTAAGAVPLLADRAQRNGQATAYVCRRFVCRRPVNDPAALAAQLDPPADS